MVWRNHARAWLHRLSSGKTETSDCSRRNSDRCYLEKPSTASEQAECTHWSNRSPETQIQPELDLQVQLQTRSNARTDRSPCCAASAQPVPVGSATDEPAMSCGTNKLQRSLSWRNMVLRRHAPTGSPRPTETRNGLLPSQECDRGLSATRSTTLSSSCDYSTALSPLRHVYSTAGIPPTPLSLARTTSHTSSSSSRSSSSVASQSTVVLAHQHHSPTSSDVTDGTHKLCSRVRSRPEQQSMPAAAPLDTKALPIHSTVSWKLSPSGSRVCASGNAAAQFYVQQAECVVLTIRDKNKQKLRMIMHSRYATVWHIKEQIQRQMGNHATQQQLTYNGLLLLNDVSLGSFISGDVATLQLDTPFRDLPMW
eukprot:jgi/Ulvmu1/4304/UM002_0025.1